MKFLTQQNPPLLHFSPTTDYMQESKFLLYGEWIRPNGHQMYDILGYIKPTREDAISTCKHLNPHFHITHIEVEE